MTSVRGRYFAVLALIFFAAPLRAQPFAVDLRAAVQTQAGEVVTERVFSDPGPDAFASLSTTRTLFDDTTVLISATSSTSLLTGIVYIATDCRDVPQACSGNAQWRDRLTINTTSLLPAETTTITIGANVTGTYSVSASSGYTLVATAATPLIVVDQLSARVSYWSADRTTTANPATFQDLQQSGNWLVYGPDVFQGTLTLPGGEINTVDLDISVIGDTDTALLADFSLSIDRPGISYTSASGVFLGGDPDTDDDTVYDVADNCITTANTDQRDTDGDGFGNACDPDIAPAENDCATEFADLNALKLAFFSTEGAAGWNPDADFDGDGEVGFGDLNLLKLFFFGPPGPAARPNLCD